MARRVRPPLVGEPTAETTSPPRVGQRSEPELLPSPHLLESTPSACAWPPLPELGVGPGAVQATLTDLLAARPATPAEAVAAARPRPAGRPRAAAESPSPEPGRVGRQDAARLQLGLVVTTA